MKIPALIIGCLTLTLSVPSRAQTAGDQRIAPGDKVVVRVYMEPDLNADVSVGSNGRISIPLLTSGVNVAGMTTDAAAKAIEAAYRDGYLKHPSVTVAVEKGAAPALSAAARKHFSISGQVVSPKAYYLPEDGKLTLLQAIGFAGGPTRIANLSKVTIVRGGQTIKVDAKKLTKEGGDPVYLQPGDVVNVPEGW